VPRGFPGVSGNPLKFPANENLKNRNTLIEHSNIKAVKGPDCALPPLKLWLRPFRFVTSRLHPSRLVLHITIYIPTTAELRIEFLKKMVDNKISITLNSYYIHCTT